MTVNEITRKTYLYTCFVVWLSYFIAIMTMYRVFYFAVAGVTTITVLMVMASKIRFGRVYVSLLPIPGFYLYLLLTSYWALYPEDTQFAVLVDSLFILVYGVSFVLAVNFNSEEITRQFVLYPWMIVAIYLYLYLTYGDIRPYDLDTARSIGATANICSTFLSVSTLFLGWRARELGTFSKVTLVLSVMLLLMSQSRTGYICLAYAVLVLVFVYSRNVQTFLTTFARIVVFITIGLGIGLMVPVTSEMISEGWQRLAEQADPTDFGEVQDGKRTGDDIERKRMYYSGWEAFNEHPVLGIGYYNLLSFTEDKYGKGFGQISHNLLITLIAESGWPALLIFLWLMMRYYRRVRRMKELAVNEAGKRLYRLCGWAMGMIILIAMFYPIMHFSLLFVMMGWMTGAEYYGPQELTAAERESPRCTAQLPAHAAYPAQLR